MIKVRSCIIASAFLFASRLVAQATPVVLVHGFYSDGTTWDATAAYLTATGNYTTFQTGAIDWTQHLSTQAASLSTFLTTLGFGTNTILVGHSQGGLVSRLTSRTNSVAGVLTIGSPHMGAPIVTQFLPIEANIALADADFYDAYYNLQDEVVCDPFDDPICDDVHPAYDYLTPATGLVLAGLAAVDVYASWKFLDLADLAPNSSVITDSLESGYGAEQTASRLSIVVDDDDEGAGPFRLLASAAAADADAYNLVSFGAVIGFDGLGVALDDDPDEDPNYFAHQEAGFAMEEVGGLMVNFEDLYNSWVGSAQNDGLVPTSGQQMPNSTPISIAGVSHTEETAQAVTLTSALNRMTGRP